MTREEHVQKILELSDEHKNLILRLPTSFGKSRIALEIIKRQMNTTASIFGCNILIVVPKLVLIDNWKDEIERWGLPDFVNVKFSTYVSYYKQTEEQWDFIILDEGHHFTENCLDANDLMRYDRAIILSATINKEARYRLKEAFSPVYEYAVQTKEAIDEGVLPNPKVLLIPLQLENFTYNQEFVKNKSKKGDPVVVSYQQRWSARGIKTKRVIIKCTQQQYYQMTSELIDWWKNNYMVKREEFAKIQWLRLCKTRLEWLAELKGKFVKQLLNDLEGYRTLTFCTSIAQTEELGEHCIHSQNDGAEVLADFNKGKFDHITACSMLDEGMNLKNCQVGLFANIGSSERVETQRFGRILRHENPLIILPFYAGTREEEIVKKMLKNYNVNLVKSVFKYQVNKKLIDDILNGTN